MKAENRTVVQVRLIGTPDDVQTVTETLKMFLQAIPSGRNQRRSRYNRDHVLTDMIIPIGEVKE